MDVASACSAHRMTEHLFRISKSQLPVSVKKPSSPGREPPQACGAQKLQRKMLHDPQSPANVFLGFIGRERRKIPIMARGWESKSVQEQQAEKLESGRAPGRRLSPQEKRRNRKREGLLLSRRRLEQQLAAASHPKHRQMLQQAIADLDRELSALE